MACDYTKYYSYELLNSTDKEAALSKLCVDSNVQHAACHMQHAPFAGYAKRLWVAFDAPNSRQQWHCPPALPPCRLVCGMPRLSAK